MFDSIVKGYYTINNPPRSAQVHSQYSHDPLNRVQLYLTFYPVLSSDIAQLNHTHLSSGCEIIGQGKQARRE